MRRIARARQRVACRRKAADRHANRPAMPRKFAPALNCTTTDVRLPMARAGRSKRRASAAATGLQARGPRQRRASRPAVWCRRCVATLRNSHCGRGDVDGLTVGNISCNGSVCGDRRLPDAHLSCAGQACVPVECRSKVRGLGRSRKPRNQFTRSLRRTAAGLGPVRRHGGLHPYRRTAQRGRHVRLRPDDLRQTRRRGPKAWGFRAGICRRQHHGRFRHSRRPGGCRPSRLPRGARSTPPSRNPRTISNAVLAPAR